MKATSWRQQLRINERRTRFVIAVFLLIYAAIGLLIDGLLLSHAYPQAPLSAIFTALVTLQAFPIATLSLSVIALLALLVTYCFHNRLMLLGTQAKAITADSATSHEEKQLYNVVEEMKVAAGLNYLPKIYLIEADYMNAFASGLSEKSAMVAITQGLLQKLNRAELQAVMAHELSHIRHHDIKLTLFASVLTNIMLMAIDGLFYHAIFGDRRRVDQRLLLVIIILRYVLPLITMLLMMYLSRTREFMADAGAVELTRTNEPLAQALMKIHNDHKDHRSQYRHDYGNTAHEDVRRAAYIYDPISMGFDPVKSFNSIFSTHPPLEDRLAALGVPLEK